MGYQDREYYREEGTGYGGIDATTMVFKLIVVNIAVFLVNLVLSGPEPWLIDRLALHGDTLYHPLSWYQFLTAGFIHDPESAWHIFLNMMGLFVFGRDVESRQGPREFLRFYLVALVVANLFWAARLALQAQVSPPPAAWLHGQMLLGASGAVTAVIIYFCLAFPQRTLYFLMLFRMPAWVFGLLVIGMNLLGQYQSTQHGKPVAYDVHLAGAAFAFAYWQFKLNFGGFWQRTTKGKWDLRRLFSTRPKLRVHAPDAEFDEPWDDELESEADHLLEKVHTQGADSLTARERKILEEYSRRVRAKRR